jgi:hypothetical protein
MAFYLLFAGAAQTDNAYRRAAFVEDQSMKAAANTAEGEETDFAFAVRAHDQCSGPIEFAGESEG